MDARDPSAGLPLPPSPSDASMSGFRRWLLEAIYPVPSPLASEEALERFMHVDLAALDADQLDRERRRLNVRLLLDDAPTTWLRERGGAIDEEVLRRG